MIRVIVLAQGNQKRMGVKNTTPKQLLPLPACNGVPIITRTMRQVLRASGDVSLLDVVALSHVWAPAQDAFSKSTAAVYGQLPGVRRSAQTVMCTTLPDPGKSSLKGIARYLERRPCEAQRTVVLLGDVVYSWRCLDALLFGIADEGVCFAGTSTLASGKGALWGVAWDLDREPFMLQRLELSLLRHPQGQLRCWMVGGGCGSVADRVAEFTRNGHYVAFDDYTMDVDTPSHIAKLEVASVAAAAEDFDRGLDWARISS